MVFETATPFDTPRLTAQLIEWTRETLSSDEHHPLLVIAVFVVRFLAIHPFQDGNGRLSRALTTLLLLRAGYTYVPYSSLERVVEENKDFYYRALRRAQQNLGEPGPHVTQWIEFFFSCLEQQASALEAKIQQAELLVPVEPLSAAILQAVREYGRITVREAVALTKANRNTVKAHIQKLVDSGKLDRHGRGRGTWYERG